MHPDVKSVNWPANSDDISPLSRVWINMCNYVDNSFPLTKNEIKYFIYVYWNEVIDADHFEDLFNQIQKCLQLVVDKEGGAIY